MLQKPRRSRSPVVASAPWIPAGHGQNTGPISSHKDKEVVVTTTPIQPRLKPIYPAYRLDDCVFRIGAQLGITAEFEDPEGHLWALVSALDGRPLASVISAVRDEFPELTEQDVRDGVEMLDNEGFLEETLPTEERSIGARYRANVNFFSRFTGLAGDRFAAQCKLNAANILLLGLGGGGSNILTLLAGVGPKSITIVDHDVVEESNLGRQFLYRESDIGHSKASAAAAAMAGMNSEVKVRAHEQRISTVEDVAVLLDDIDLVISAIDEPPFVAQRLVNKAIVQAGVPCVFGASQVSRGRVFTVIPGETGCFDCLNVHYSQRDPQFVSQFSAFRDISFDPPSIAYGPAIFLLTATIVDEAVRVLSDYAPPRSLGTQFEVNFEDKSSFTHPSWPRLKELCPTCGEGDVRDWEIFSHYLQQV